MFAPFDAAFAMLPSSVTTIPRGGQHVGAGGPTGRRDNVAPHVWGPSMWKLMHVIATTYPDNPTHQDAQQFATFFASLQSVLPCEGCRKGYAMLVGGQYRLTDDVLANRHSLFRWTVDVHNAVNKKLGKKVDSNYRRWFAHYKNMS
jgi:hypothetical protein